MAKPDESLAGCSGHLHVSLKDEHGTNLFFDEQDPSGMSALMKHFVAGVLACMPSMMPLYAPTVNSYKRLVENYFAPVKLCWGVENRTAGRHSIWQNWYQYWNKQLFIHIFLIIIIIIIIIIIDILSSIILYYLINLISVTLMFPLNFFFCFSCSIYVFISLYLCAYAWIAIRVITPKTTGSYACSPSGTRAEIRVSGADINVYLALAAIFASGLYGIENKLQLPPPIQGDVMNNEGSCTPLTRLPRNLGEAIEAMQAKKSLARLVLGYEFVDHFVGSRLEEWRLYERAVTEWERRRYFELVWNIM
jgi:glutamine synthetase